MIINIFQHEEFEKPALIHDWAISRNHSLNTYKTFKGEFPDDNQCDLLIVLGGSMSANDEIDWLNKEKDIIKNHIKNEKLILGICLGAQIIAKLLGAKVYKNHTKEIGWFPITCIDNFLQKKLIVFHWHEETFDLPNGATLLASSEACINQAFAYSDNIVGLQFHLEMDKEAILDITKNHSYTPGTENNIQSIEQIINKLNYVEQCKEELFDLLDGFESSIK